MSPVASASAIFHDTMYGSIASQHQYAQSYERYRSPTPSTAGQPAPISRLIMTEGNSERPAKRVRYPSTQESNPHESVMLPPTSSTIAPISANTFGTPLTPASTNSDEPYATIPPKLLESPDLRRLSVNSLLSGPPGIPYQSDRMDTPRSSSDGQDWAAQYQESYHDTTTWGIDRGIKDLDIGKNDDLNAISTSSPVGLRDHLEIVLNEVSDSMPVEFGFGTEVNNTAFETGGYYDKPVPISIPRLLEPLPAKLLENPMNLLVRPLVGCVRRLIANHI